MQLISTELSIFIWAIATIAAWLFVAYAHSKGLLETK
jgi:hypothetical protein